MYGIEDDEKLPEGVLFVAGVPVRELRPATETTGPIYIEVDLEEEMRVLREERERLAALHNSELDTADDEA